MDMREAFFEFKSTERSRKSFGTSVICQDLIAILHDWAQGEREALADMDLKNDLMEASRAQGRISLAIYFATFLETLKDIKIEEENKDDS